MFKNGHKINLTKTIKIIPILFIEGTLNLYILNLLHLSAKILTINRIKTIFISGPKVN